MEEEKEIRPPDPVRVESLLPSASSPPPNNDDVVWFDEQDHQIMEAIRSSLEDEIRRVEALRQKYAMIHSRLRMIASTSRDPCALALSQILDQEYGHVECSKQEEELPDRKTLVEWISKSGRLFLPLLELSYFNSD